MAKDDLLLSRVLSTFLESDIVCQISLESEIKALNQEEDLSVNNDNKYDSSVINLNPEYTFDNFIIGESNKLSRNAVLASCVNPGEFYNPLFIYGDSGLGKTHLLHAAGNYLKNENSNLNVIFITAADFVDGVFKSSKNIGKTNLDEYRRFLCSADILLFDEIQFLSDKKKSVEIFFHIFNTLVNNKKQIILTSDRAPEEISGIEERLVSRFVSGLTTNIIQPEYETAVRIIKSKIDKKTMDLDIDDDVIDYIATHYSSDVRKIEGTLNLLIFNLINSEKEKIDFVFAVNILNNSTRGSKKDLNTKSIKNAVKNYYGLSKGQIESKSRQSNISFARHIAMFLCRRHLDISFKEIGENFGGKDHSTVIKGINKIENSIRNEKDVKLAIKQIEEKFLL